MLKNNIDSILLIHNKWVLLGTFLVSLLFLPLLTVSLLDHPPEYDELLHLLSARSINVTGEPDIADGYYDRAKLFTSIVASVLSRNGDESGGNELKVARLPALLFGMLLVGLIGAWVTRKVGWLAGLTAAFVLAIAPSTIHLSVLVRFYTLHALVMTLMLILIYESMIPGRTIRFIGPAIATVVLLFFIGVQLHALTLITSLAGVTALACLIFYDHQKTFIQVFRKHPFFSAALIIVILTAIAAAGQEFGIIDRLRGTPPVWSEVRANNYVFYLSELGSRMPLLWPLFPIMVIFAFASNARLTIFCAVVVIVALIANSIAAQKATRYIYHVLPIICVLWGVGFQTIIRHVTVVFSERSKISVPITLLVVLMGVLLCFASTQEFKRALKLISGRGVLDKSIPVKNEPDWLVATPILRPLLATDSRLVVTSGVKGLHAFGRYDYELSSTVVAETQTGAEFSLDDRTGRHVISTADSVSQVIDGPGIEIFVLENRMLNKFYSASSDVVSTLNDRCTILNLPASSQLTAWQCRL